MLLINTIDELRAYIPVDVNMRFETVQPSVEEAQELFIKPLLGAYYPILLEAYNAGEGEGEGEPDEDANALLPHVQRALAYYSLYLSVENVGSSVGDMGIQQQMGRDSQPAPRWKVRELKLKYLTQADKFADKLLEYLEDNATLAKYTQWFTDETANTSIQGVIVYSTRIASQYIDINESRRVFLRLKKRIREIERGEIKRLICSAQYDQLITQLMNNGQGEGEGYEGLTDDNRALVDVLEPYIAKRALYLTIPSLAVNITHEGITMHSVSDSLVIEQAAGMAEKDALKKSLKLREMNGYEADEDTIRQFIADNISSFPLIEASPCWTSRPDPGPKFIPENDPCNKHFSV